MFLVIPSNFYHSKRVILYSQNERSCKIYSHITESAMISLAGETAHEQSNLKSLSPQKFTSYIYCIYTQIFSQQVLFIWSLWGKALLYTKMSVVFGWDFELCWPIVNSQLWKNWTASLLSDTHVGFRKQTQWEHIS